MRDFHKVNSKLRIIKIMKSKIVIQTDQVGRLGETIILYKHCVGKPQMYRPHGRRRCI
jgi:hypothetical protein